MRDTSVLDGDKEYARDRHSGDARDGERLEGTHFHGCLSSPCTGRSATRSAACRCKASNAPSDVSPHASSQPIPSTSPLAFQRMVNPSCVMPRARILGGLMVLVSPY